MTVQTVPVSMRSGRTSVAVLAPAGTVSSTVRPRQLTLNENVPPGHPAAVEMTLVIARRVVSSKTEPRSPTTTAEAVTGGVSALVAAAVLTIGFGFGTSGTRNGYEQVKLAPMASVVGIVQPRATRSVRLSPPRD